MQQREAFGIPASSSDEAVMMMMGAGSSTSGGRGVGHRRRWSQSDHENENENEDTLSYRSSVASSIQTRWEEWDGGAERRRVEEMNGSGEDSSLSSGAEMMIRNLHPEWVRVSFLLVEVEGQG